MISPKITLGNENPFFYHNPKGNSKGFQALHPCLRQAGFWGWGKSLKIL